ncbi:MAG TPA: hypothetical protein VE080_01595 [Candidatus Aquicultoraceae bacterium]|nr:hypothetical protein [Candidatus Aquicultoraceae bacterium]
MKLLRNDRGVALVFVLLLSVVALIVTAGMLHLLARGGFISGQQKRYHTAREAARGGAEATFQVIGDGGADTMGLGASIGGDLATKITTATAGWGAGVDSSSTINPTDNNTYDLRFDIGTYRIHSKIVDTFIGNSGPDTGLLKVGVVNAGSGEVTVMNVPYLFTIEELSQSQANPTERAKLSILYQY